MYVNVWERVCGVYENVCIYFSGWESSPPAHVFLDSDRFVAYYFFFVFYFTYLEMVQPLRAPLASNK